MVWIWCRRLTCSATRCGRYTGCREEPDSKQEVRATARSCMTLPAFRYVPADTNPFHIRLYSTCDEFGGWHRTLLLGRDGTVENGPSRWAAPAPTPEMARAWADHPDDDESHRFGHAALLNQQEVLRVRRELNRSSKSEFSDTDQVRSQIAFYGEVLATFESWFRERAIEFPIRKPERVVSVEEEMSAEIYARAAYEAFKGKPLPKIAVEFFRGASPSSESAARKALERAGYYKTGDSGTVEARVREAYRRCEQLVLNGRVPR